MIDKPLDQELKRVMKAKDERIERLRQRVEELEAALAAVMTRQAQDRGEYDAAREAGE